MAVLLMVFKKLCSLINNDRARQAQCWGKGTKQMEDMLLRAYSPK